MRMAGDDAIVLVAAAPERMRNADAHYPYRQDAISITSTGFPKPDAVLALMPGREHGEAILFCRERDPERERWDGPRDRHRRRGAPITAWTMRFRSTTSTTSCPA